VSRKLQLAVFAAGLAIFAILVYRAGVPGLIHSLKAARWALLPAVLAWGAVYACNTVAWRLLIDNGPPPGLPSIPFGRAYAITVSSFALNYVTPMISLGGEPFRVAAAAEYLGGRRAASSVVSFRIVHTLGQLLFWLTAIPIAYVVVPKSWRMTVALIVLCLALLGITILLLGLFRHGFVEKALDVLHRIPGFRRLANKIEPRRASLVAIDDRMADLYAHHRRRLLSAIAIEYIGRAIAMLEYFFIARALGLDVDYGTAFAIGAFSQLVSNMTFFIPFDIGTKEGGLFLIFSALHLPADMGVDTAIVSRLREMVWIALGLALMWGVRRSPKASVVPGTTPPSPATRPPG
jgi:uncharacterized protein (TIRG00374 family)